MTIPDFDFNSVESFASNLQFCAKWNQFFLQVLSSGLVKHYEMMMIIVESSTWPFEMMKFIVLSQLQVIVVDRISRILFPFAFFVGHNVIVQMNIFMNSSWWVGSFKKEER